MPGPGVFRILNTKRQLWSVTDFSRNWLTFFFRLWTHGKLQIHVDLLSTWLIVTRSGKAPVMRLVVTLRGTYDFVESLTAHTESVHRSIRAMRLTLIKPMVLVCILCKDITASSHSLSRWASLFLLHAGVVQSLERGIQRVGVRRGLVILLLLREKFRTLCNSKTVWFTENLAIAELGLGFVRDVRVLRLLVVQKSWPFGEGKELLCTWVVGWVAVDLFTVCYTSEHFLFCLLSYLELF